MIQFRREDSLPDDFPLGDGTADTEASVSCPYCGETVDIAVDPGGGAAQDYVEDCPVCCRPWHVHVRFRGNGRVRVSLEEEGS